MKSKVIKILLNPKKILLFLESRGLFNFFSDKSYIKLMYKIRVGKNVNLFNPKTFNEKIQWLKLYDRNSKYTMMVDKYEVRKYIAETIGEEYLVQNLGVWDNFEDIDFNKLPNQFVLKCTHDSGGLVICRDKSLLDIHAAKKKINRCLKRNFYYHGREWPYKNVRPRIIAEEFIAEDIKDYKFYCFNGKQRYLYISQGLENHETARISFYDMEFKKAPFGRSDYLPFIDSVEKPKNFEFMQDLAIKLAGDLPFIRVDMYNVNDKIYFSELTFSPCSGFMPFDPPEYDEYLGSLLKLPNKDD